MLVTPEVEQATIERALVLEKERDTDALYVLLGKQDKAIAKAAELVADPALDPPYDSTHMGLIDDLKTLGKRIVADWSRRLHDLVCGGGASEADRDKLFSALNVSEVAAIGAVTSMLLPLGVPPPLAAPIAVVVVRQFLKPAGKQICDFWGEKLDEHPA